jgi:hypothetical protein
MDFGGKRAQWLSTPSIVAATLAPRIRARYAARSLLSARPSIVSTYASRSNYITWRSQTHQLSLPADCRHSPSWVRMNTRQKSSFSLSHQLRTK